MIFNISYPTNNNYKRRSVIPQVNYYSAALQLAFSLPRGKPILRRQT